jgi:hypothetical protein
MDNNRPRTGSYSHFTETIQHVVTDAIRNYFTGAGHSTAQPTQQPPPQPQPHRNANATMAQLIATIRELIRSNTTVIDRYNAVMQDHVRSTRELIDIIRVLAGQQSQPIHRNSNRSAGSSAYDYFPQEQRRPPPLRQPTPNNLFSYLLYPSTIRPRDASLFQDVIVRPTPAQIDIASESFEYDGIVELLNTQCPITMCEFQIGDRVRRIHYCRHSFHEESFLSWFQNHVRCPVCRHDIREHSAPRATNQLNDSDSDDDSDGHSEGEGQGDGHGDGHGITGSYTVHEPSTVSNSQPATTIPVNNNQTNNSNSLGNSLEILLRAALAFDPSNNNATDLRQYLRSSIDISNTPILTFEFPIEYEEYYDSSDNLLGRGFMGRR